MPGPPPVVYLKGGPCNGTLHKLSADELNNDTVVCKGADYKPDPKLTKHDGHDVWLYQKPTPPPKPLKAASVHKGYADIRHSLNAVMPDSLRNAQRAQRETLRALARAHKVRIR